MSALKQIIAYCAVGLINTATDLFIFVFLATTLHMPVVLSNILSYSTGLCVSFALNRNLTFRKKYFARSLSVQFVRFLVINLIALAGSTAGVWLCSGVLDPLSSKLVTIPPVIAWGFLCSRLFVFEEKKLVYQTALFPFSER